MNKWIGVGRATADPEIRYSQNDNSIAVARYTLAVDRKYTESDGSRRADFIRIVAFGKSAEFAEKYIKKGVKMMITGRIQTDSYTNKDGVRVYTTDIIAEEQEFCESKKSSEAATEQPKTDGDGFMNLPEGIEDELPFAQPK